MTDLDSSSRFYKYYQVISPSEIKINKEDIFYREKYSDIINYIKVMLTNYKDLGIQNYFKPKGALLININPGTDILSYLKLITKNYYLDFIDFNNIEIFKTPEDFFNVFNFILKNIEKNKLKEKELKPDKKDEKEFKETEFEKSRQKRLIFLNQQKDFKQLFNGKSLLKNFIIFQQQINNSINFVDNDLILVWINYDIQEIIDNSNNLFNTFDIFIKIPLLNKIERETILRNFLDKNKKISFDVNAIVSFTEKWETNDIIRLLKIGIFKKFINSELNDTSNEITNILIDLIESGEYLPLTTRISLEEKESEEKAEKSNIKIDKISNKNDDNGEKIKDTDFFVNQIRETSISEFMLNQLYENAASKNYNELIIIIDKLSKKEPPEDNDRKLLAMYPFILNDSPNLAQINLEKAKKRIDLMKQAFKQDD
ncbi:MAG: hypothetical protein ACTSUT_05665 [Promethearchaeota archaeon]